MHSLLRILATLFLTLCAAAGQNAETLSGKRIAFLGDSITQGGAYISYTSYYLHKLHPELNFDIYPLGLASETVSGLSEPGHAGGAFPRPCLFERLGRLLERVKPEIVFACYGMNDGIYLPPSQERLDAFKAGITRLLKECRSAGVKEIFLITPPIFDTTVKPGEFNYDAVLTQFAAWQTTLQEPGLHVIDLHSAMRRARDAQEQMFSKDHIHPGEEGHLLMARTILCALHISTPAGMTADIHNDALYKAVDHLRRYKWEQWMNHIGYTREKTVSPAPLDNAPGEVLKLQEQIDALRSHSGKN